MMNVKSLSDNVHVSSIVSAGTFRFNYDPIVPFKSCSTSCLNLYSGEHRGHDLWFLSVLCNMVTSLYPATEVT